MPDAHTLGSPGGTNAKPEGVDSARTARAETGTLGGRMGNFWMVHGTGGGGYELGLSLRPEKKKLPTSGAIKPLQSASRRVSAVGHWPTGIS